MKIAMYYTRPFETGGIEKTMYARGKYLSEQGYDITFIYASNDSPLDMLEKWATIGNVKHIDICKDEIFDWCISDRKGVRRWAQARPPKRDSSRRCPCKGRRTDRSHRRSPPR